MKLFDIFDPDGEVSTEYNGSLTFEYNEDGIRTAKIVNGIRHEYVLNGSQILAERIIESDGEITLVYIYDENGSPIGMKYRTKSYAKGVYDTFYFEKNLQADMIDRSQTAQQNAERMMNEKYGKGNWKTGSGKSGPEGDYNKIVKWITRGGYLNSLYFYIEE